MNKKLTSYQKLLLDPRWIKRSKEIIERDRICQKCGNDKNLQAHHLIYLTGRKPWEYPDDWLVTLCNRCHVEETIYSRQLTDIIREIRVSGMWSEEIINKFFKGINDR